MKLLIDFESRSKVDLRKRGAYVYAADPSTEIMCCAFKADNGPTLLWLPPTFDVELPGNMWAATDDELLEAVAEADELGAHNAQFERLMWREIMVKRHGFPPQETHRWRCSAARAAALALPRHLDGVGAALNLPIQKDKEGHKLMLRMCKPTKTGDWIEDAASIIRLAQYCVQDVETEHAVEQALPPLPESEERIWQLDQEINDRGIAFDADGARAIKEMVAEEEKKLLAEVAIITDGEIMSPRQVQATIEWLDDNGVEMGDLKKGTVALALETSNDPKARRILEIRQALSLSSVKKIDAMLMLGSDDDRIRGAFLYYAATTGRWGGKGIQPQNFPRDSYKDPSQVDAFILGIYEGCPIKAASRSLRGLLIPRKGNVLTASDYSAIEARILAWLANEQHVMDGFRAGLDMYKVAASAIYSVPYDKVTPDQRQVGKTAELACGFQGFTGAFKAMSALTGVNVGDDDNIKSIIMPWRENRPGTTALWRGLEAAAIKTVITGKVHRYGKILFGIKGIYLFMRLPSGRMLAYPYPTIEKRETPYGVEKDVVTFMGTNPYTRKWERQSTYGGKFTENAVSGIAADVLRDGMINVDMFDIPIVMTAHDEITVDALKDYSEFLAYIMRHSPPWAPDLLLGATAWSGPRYRK